MSKPTVLVLTAEEDATADAVIRELLRRRVQVVRLDTGDFPGRLRLAASNEGGCWTGRLDGCDVGVDLAEVEAVYYRRPTRFRLPAGLSAGDAQFAAAEARLGFGGVLAALDVRWVNDPMKVAVAEYKPVQLRVASEVGLATPRSLITNDHKAAAAFAAGKVVCKTFSSLLLAEADGMRMTFTTPVQPVQLDPAQLGATAHLLQEWVPKAFEVRLTVVGDRQFGVAIHADSEQGRVDWRSDYPALRYELVDVPESTAIGVAAYLARFGLSFGAFDFVVTPDGEWVMLECNPAGQWLWLEHESGVPIAAAMADLLSAGATR